MPRKDISSMFSHAARWKKKLLLMLLISCLPLLAKMKDCEIIETNQEEVWVTVFVHGILSIKPHLSVSNVIKLMRDSIDDSVYALTVELIRNDPFFYQYHPMQEIGLKQINLTTQMPGAGASAFAVIYDEISKLAQPPHIKNLYYTFGWSGLLSPRIRLQEAKRFFTSLLELQQELNDQGICPKFRIVAYSHGGNTALMLAQQYDNPDHKINNFFIDELILWGVPIISDSDFFVNSTLFKTVYHFYSHGDRVQPLDCFSLNRFFSNRTFEKNARLKVPNNLTQILFRVKRPSMHGKKCLQHLESDSMLAYSKLRNADPGHTELWSFGWTAANFRKNFPLFPFPAAVFTPWLIKTLKENSITHGKVILEVHAHHECMLVKHQATKTTYATSFLTKTQMNILKEYSIPFIPAQCTSEVYNQKIKDAMQLARTLKQQEKHEQKTIKDSINQCYGT